MLKFMREKAHIFGWGIVIFFVGTMFSGAFSLKNMFHRGPQKTMASSQLAMVGDTPVSTEKYSELLNQTMMQFQKQHVQRLEPEMAEMVAYSALNQAAQFTLLKEGAKKSNIKIKGSDVDIALEAVYRQYDLKGKSQLKDLLKKNKYPYKDFIASLKQDIQIQKFTENLRKQVHVSEKDVQNKYTQVSVEHLLLLSDNKKDEDVLKRIQPIEKMIRGGMPFEKAVSQYSEDTKTRDKNGSLGWVRTGQTLQEFEEVAFGLDKGGISGPVKTAVGYHLIKVLDKKINVPTTLNMAAEKAAVLQDKQNRAIQNFVQGILAHSKLTVIDPSLKAYHAKIFGDIPGAIAAYQSQISANPSNPIPHYLLAKLYALTKEPEHIKEELDKANLKADLNPGLDFPGLHILTGKYAGEAHLPQEKAKQFTKAIALATDRFSLKGLESTFKNMKEPEFEREVQQALAKIPQEPSPLAPPRVQ